MGRTPTSIAKITRPKLSGVLHRERLFTLLDSGRHRPLIWVSGAPGSGKTTLVSSYLDARNLPSLWYQVDERDADIATFFYYMGMAAHKVAPKKRKPLPLLTPEYLQDVPTFTRRYFENLYNRLDPPFAVVFDNYHAVPVESQIHDVVSLGLSLIPEGGCAIVISRAEPPPSFARMRAHEQIALIDNRTLRLTADESEGIAQLRGIGGQAHETVKLLHERTEGWTAGFVLILELMKAKGMPPESLTQRTPQVIFDYFAGEIFQKADSETKEFLKKTAFLPAMTVETAERISGLSTAGRILEDMVRKNYFTIKHSSFEPVYQYHPLFHEFLLAKVHAESAPEDLSGLQRAAAGLLENSGQVEDAVHLLKNMQDWDSLARLILTHAPLLMTQGRSRTLEDWLVSLPQAVVDAIPWLLYWRGACRLSFDLVEARRYFERAFELFRKHDDVTGLFLSWSGVVNTFIYEWGDFTPADEWIAILDKLLDCYPDFPSPEIEMHVATSMFGILVYRQPRHPKIHEWEERLQALIPKVPDINQRMMIGNHLVVYYLWMGEYAKAELVINTLHPSSRSPELAPLALTTWHQMAAAYNWFTASYDACIETVEEGLRGGAKTGVHIWDFLLLAHGAWGSLIPGEHARTAAYLQRMSAVMNRAHRLDVAHYHHIAGLYAMNTGDLPGAVEHLQTAVKLASEAGVPYPEAVTRLGLAQALFEQGDRRKAEVHLSAARKAGRDMNCSVIEYQGLLLEALITLRSGNEEQCLSFLRRGLALGKKQGYFNDPWWVPSVMTRVCVKALEAGIEVEYVQELVRKRNLVPDTPPLEIESWPWPVKIYTLGGFSLLLDGEPVQFPARAQHKPLELLKALIAFGGRDVGSERLAETLWPDARGDAAQSALDTTLHRLRKMLGHEKAVELREGQVSLDPRYCWVDVLALERLLNEAENTKSPELTERALLLYRGPFLGQETVHSWAIPVGERLRNRVLRHLGRECRLWEDTKKWQKAVDCYQGMLAVDDLTEEAYQRLMLSYQHMGRRAEALAVYQRCRKTLSAVFGIQPSPETEAIYKSLRENQ